MRFRLFPRGDGSERSQNLSASSCFHGLWREPQCVIVRTLRAQADSFNACNQLWNADRLENLSTDVTFYRNNSS